MLAGVLRLVHGLSILLLVLCAVLVTASVDSRRDEGNASAASTSTSSTTAPSSTQSSSSSTSAPPASPSVSTCEARTINYITHGLPQSCLTSAWTSPSTTASDGTAATTKGDEAVTAVTEAGSDVGENSEPGTPTNSTGTQQQAQESRHGSADDAAETPALEEEPGAGRFMSFEDWKEAMLRQAGQDPSDLKQRKPSEHGAGDRAAPDSGNFGLGEEGEINLDFGKFMGDGGGDGREKNRDAAVQDGGAGSGSEYDDAALSQEGRPSIHRSKDAGKTCKERFSYSSFDAGATVLKTGPSTKNAKAILVENKDSYMLLECAAQAKYVIVELSDDILVDTVVLANFEFFSSMVRHFRLSVSDRYPVKLDKWRELGVFEARNSRDIQPFLVDNPQIWAKYIRIEFLTNYGNEFYCPISLLRVHGSRMLDSWKEIEPGREEELMGDDEGVPAISAGQDDTPEVQSEPESTETPSSEPTEAYADPIVEVCPVPTAPGVDLFCAWPVCNASQPGINETMGNASMHFDFSSDHDTHGNILHPNNDTMTVTQSPNASDSIKPSSSASTSATSPVASRTSSPQSPPSTPHADDRTSTPSSAATSVSTPSASGSTSSQPATNQTAPHNSTASSKASSSSSTATTGSKPRNAGGSGGGGGGSGSGPSVASPTVQEGFFNAITKRLHQVESNLTLSLKYIEDQSRQMQDALRGAEQKQTTTVSSFLDNLNQTVLAELRSVRDQYDQIWQSTVIALDTQREQYERDIVALSSRLNLLADEVVFQKRMAIVQAVLLLSCLFLVIFSRGVSLPSFSPLLDPTTTATPYGSPSSSSLYQRTPRVVPESPPHSPPRLDGAMGDESPAYIKPHRQSHDARFASTDDIPSVRVIDTDTPIEYQRMSPPRSPSPPPDEPEDQELEAIASGHEAPSGAVRRTSALQHNQTRKPLPALPENPASP